MTDEKKALSDEQIEGASGGMAIMGGTWRRYNNSGATILQCPNCGGTDLDLCSETCSLTLRCRACYTVFSKSECPHVTSGKF